MNERLMTMKEVADILDVGRTTLFKKLREMDIIFKQYGFNYPRRRYADYLKLKHVKRHGKKAGHAITFEVPAIYCTEKGLRYLREKI